MKRLHAALRVFVFMCLAPLAALAQDKADLDRTQIIGNRELPKVTIVVPWKKPLPGALAGRPVQSVLDEALAPLDRDVLKRQIAFDSQRREVLQNPPLSTTASTTASTTPPAPAPEKKP